MEAQPDSGITEQTISEFLVSESAVASKAGSGTWASLLRILDPRDLETKQIFEFDQDEGAFRFDFILFIR